MPKKNLFIIGAGGFGRELESWLDMVPSDQRDWEIAGFLDDTQEVGNIKNYPSDYKILGGIYTYPLTKDDLAIIAISDPSAKEKIFNTLISKVNFLTFISPLALLGKFNKIGEGSVICPNTAITTNVNIGKCVSIIGATNIGHDVVIGDFTTLMVNADIGGNCKLGSKVIMGTGSAILPRKKIADGVKIGIGSIIIRDINRKSTIFGNPGKNLRTLLSNNNFLKGN